MGKEKERGKATRYITRASGLIIVLVALLCTPFIALAADTAPDDLSIESAIASRNLIETGDFLFTVQFEVDWDSAASYPEEGAIDQTFLVQLIDSGTQIATVAPYPFYNDGYGHGVVSFYFSGTDAATLAWGDPYTIRITSQPGWITPIVSYDYAMGSSDYCPDTDQDDNQDWLKDWIIDAAEDIENAWGISDTLTTVSVTDVLTELGESYFGRVIPGLRYLCPGLFTVNTRSPGWQDETWSHANETAVEGQWDGSGNWVENALEGVDELIGGRFILLNFVMIGGVLAVMMVSFARYQTARPGLLLGLLVLVVATDQGMFEVAALTFIAFLFLLYSGYKIFDLQKA